jgi:hypothetical protein
MSRTFDRCRPDLIVPDRRIIRPECSRFGLGFVSAMPILAFNVGSADEDQADRSTYEFNSVSYGGAAADNRIIGAFIVTFNSSVTLNAAAIGGVSATILGPSSGTDARTWFIYAAVPTGTSGTITFTFSGTAPNGYFGCYSLYPTSATPVSTSFPAGGSATSRSVTLDIPENGLALVCAGRTGGGSISNATNSPSGPSTGAVYGYRQATTTAENDVEFTHGNTRTIAGVVWA